MNSRALLGSFGSHVSKPSIAWIFMAVLALTHFYRLAQFAVDLPYMDEWDALQPGQLSETVQWHWIVGSHNEHRIVFTKLLAWIQFNLDGHNYRHTIFANFFLYIFLNIIIMRSALTTNWQRLIYLLFAFSTLSHENFAWAFQNSFHLVLLFFMASVLTADRVDKGWPLSPLFAVAAVFTLGCGIVLAAVTACYWALLGVGHKTKPRIQALRILLLFVAAVFWLQGYQPNPGHPAPALPWTGAFWTYFLNILSLGFGFAQITSLIPGMLVLTVCSVGIFWGIKLVLRSTSDPAFRPLLMLFAGFGCLALIAISRAGFGVGQAKSSRYAEMSLLILPFFLFFIEKMLIRYRVGNTAKIAVGAVLALPALTNYSIESSYRNAFQVRNESATCVGDYYRGNNAGDCPGYIANLAEHLEQAKAIKIHFATTGALAP